MKRLENPTEIINKATYNVVVGAIKDSVQSTLLSALSTKTFELDVAKQRQLLAVLEQAVDAGYHKSNAVFMRTVARAFAIVKAEESSSKK